MSRVPWSEIWAFLGPIAICMAVGIIGWGFCMLHFPKPLTDYERGVAELSAFVPAFAIGFLMDYLQRSRFQKAVGLCSWPASVLALAVIAAIVLIEFDQNAVPDWLWRLAMFVEYPSIREYWVGKFASVDPDRFQLFVILSALLIGSFLVCVTGNEKAGRFDGIQTWLFAYRFWGHTIILSILSIVIAATVGSNSDWYFLLFWNNRAPEIERVVGPHTAHQLFHYGSATIAVLLLWGVWFRFTIRSRSSEGVSLKNIFLGAAEVASRGKAIVIGLFFTAAAAWLLGIAAFRLYSPRHDFTDWTATLIGGPIGLYFLFARGIGPIWVALSWSSNVKKKPLGAARFASGDELKQAGVLQDA